DMTEPCPQTGDAGAMSYPGLVFDRDDAEAAAEFLRDVVELVVERCTAQMEDRGRRIDELAIRQPLNERLVTRRAHQFGHAVHRPLEVDHVPIARTRLAMQHAGGAIDILVQLIGRRALGAERPLVVRAARITLDIDDLALFHVDQGTASDRAEGADAWHRLAALD